MSRLQAVADSDMMIRDLRACKVRNTRLNDIALGGRQEIVVHGSNIDVNKGNAVSRYHRLSVRRNDNMYKAKGSP